MSTAATATALKVSVRTVHRLVATGRLTPYVTGPGQTGGYLFATDDVQAFAATIGRAA
jgi:hypothetical protein